MAVTTYKQAVEQFLAEATWLTPTDTPMVVHLQAIAAALDIQAAGDGVQSALSNTFGVTWARLEKKRPVEVEEEETDDDLEFS